MREARASVRRALSLSVVTYVSGNSGQTDGQTHRHTLEPTTQRRSNLHRLTATNFATSCSRRRKIVQTIAGKHRQFCY